MSEPPSSQSPPPIDASPPEEQIPDFRATSRSSALRAGLLAMIVSPMTCAASCFIAAPGHGHPALAYALWACALGGAAFALFRCVRARSTGGSVMAAIAVLLTAPGFWWIHEAINFKLTGGAWGRPLRIRGRILHPELRAGSDWTRGERPAVERLDAATRAALEALWLHDAQKEHASVPAFSRIGWLLTAVGAPAELVEGAHRAALEEIDHARRCFALAAGYGGRSHSVEPMPDLLVGGLDLRGDPRVVMAVESLKDGCLLEDFNADVAAACVEVCEDPAAKDVLSRIAREERSHAELSWQMLEWLLARGGDRVRSALEEALSELSRVARPTAVSAEKAPLVQRADPAQMRAHGRLPDEAWAALWRERVAATERRCRALLSGEARAAA